MLVGKCRNVSIIVAMLIFLEPAEKVPCKNVSRIAKEGEKNIFKTCLFINFLANSPRLEYPVVSIFHGAISPRLINENFVVPSSCLWDFQDPVLVLTGGAWGEGVPPGHMLQDWAPKRQTGSI